MAASALKPTVSIVIPVFNQWDLTRGCLASLAAHAPRDTEIILVDNGSTDTTATEAASIGARLFGDRFRYLPQNGNLGFAKGCNRGAETATGRYLFFLNNDTVVTAGFLEPLIAPFKKDPKLAGTGPLLLFPNDGSVRAGRVQHMGIAVSHGPEFRHLYELFPANHPAVTRQRKLQVITAAALLLPSPLFKAHGGFHEEFVNGMEDVDLCCRISARGGHFTVIPESVVFHHTNSTEGRFINESDNLRLLLSRCRNVPEDLGRFLAEDGLELGFTPWLELVARLPQVRANALIDSYGNNPDPARLTNMLEEEPLWDAGYGLLAQCFEGNGDIEQAVAPAYLRTLLCPGLEAYAECARIAAKAGHGGLAGKYQGLLADLKGIAADPAGLKRKADGILRKTQDGAVKVALGQALQP